MPAVDLLMTALSRPAAYPFPVDRIVVYQTHISLVFLAGDFVYKVKKPVSLGFLDFSDLEKRRHFCEREVRLNRRLAPKVYLGVVPIAEENGRLTFEGKSEPVEWAVKMLRLPAEATLESRLRHDEIDAAELNELAARLARFHRGAERGAGEGTSDNSIASFGRFDVVAGNMRENFDQTAAQMGAAVHPSVFERVRTLCERELSRHQTLIESRAVRGVPCDTQGDLHLDHVYHFPQREPPGDWVIIDCIEFNDRFRYADPWADVAFLVMDLAFHGRRDLARHLALAYAKEADDAEGLRLASLYAAYRAVVRAKVDGMQFAEKEVPDEKRQAALMRACAHWLLALGLLEETTRRPCLLLVGGLPGTGKSTVSRELAATMNFTLIRSDEVRKELAAHEPTNLYTVDWTRRTYVEMARRTENELWTGKRVLVDANFRLVEQRAMFEELAARWAAPFLFLECTAPPEVVRRRLEARSGDASDADWSVYQQLAPNWQPLDKSEQRYRRQLDTAAEPDFVLRLATTAILEAVGGVEQL